MPNLRAVCAALLMALLPAPARAAAAATPPPVADFFENPTMSAPALSPDGRYLAVRLSAKGKHDWLTVINLADFSQKPVALFKDAGIGYFRWISDQRLIYRAADRDVAPGDMRYASGLYAVDKDGGRFRQLAGRDWSQGVRGNVVLQAPNTYPTYQAGQQDSDSIYLYAPGYSESGVHLYTDLKKLDTVTGKTTEVESPHWGQVWTLDQRGEPRLLTTKKDDQVTLHYLDPAQQRWRALRTEKLYLGQLDDIAPLGFAPDGALYVVSNDGKDKAALYRYDLGAAQLIPKALVALEGFDFSGSLITDDQKLLGVAVNADARATVWFDPAMNALQAELDSRLPDTVNLLMPARRAATPWLLVVSYSDRQPDRYLLYNRDSKQLRTIGSEAPRIMPAQMGSRELVHYKARDGLDIPAWLTLPPGEHQAKGLPMVVLVHGGPYARGGDWRWDADAQFLATRGYAVLEPEFRGSSGYGAAHYTAGFKQWGLKMQDDIADGTRWAIAEGTADPQRICIAGASYGGYATLMGLIKDTELYRCGVAWAGVTDIDLMYDPGWFRSSDISDEWKKYGMPNMVGDRVKDAGQWQATSPLQQAARLTQPLLMAYGSADRRVPIVHGKKFLDAVRRTNSQVEWIEYEGEGHGWYLPQNRIDFWTRVEKFLAKYNGPQLRSAKQE